MGKRKAGGRGRPVQTVASSRRVASLPDRRRVNSRTTDQTVLVGTKTVVSRRILLLPARHNRLERTLKHEPRGEGAAAAKRRELGPVRSAAGGGVFVLPPGPLALGLSGTISIHLTTHLRGLASGRAAGQG